MKENFQEGQTYDIYIPGQFYYAEFKIAQNVTKVIFDAIKNDSTMDLYVATNAERSSFAKCTVATRGFDLNGQGHDLTAGEFDETFKNYYTISYTLDYGLTPSSGGYYYKVSDPKGSGSKADPYYTLTMDYKEVDGLDENTYYAGTYYIIENNEYKKAEGVYNSETKYYKLESKYVQNTGNESVDFNNAVKIDYMFVLNGNKDNGVKNLYYYNQSEKKYVELNQQSLKYIKTQDGLKDMDLYILDFSELAEPYIPNKYYYLAEEGPRAGSYLLDDNDNPTMVENTIMLIILKIDLLNYQKIISMKQINIIIKMVLNISYQIRLIHLKHIIKRMNYML